MNQEAMPVLLLRCVIVLVITLLQSHHSTSQSNPDEWWTASCGVAEGHEENRSPGQSYRSPLGSSPWQVAIFTIPRTAVQSGNPRVVRVAAHLDLICVGTIITPSIIITAASCLFMENTRKPIRPEMLRVVAGKQLLSLKLERHAQKREVQIVKLVETYEGEITLQADNIAILVPKRPFEFNKYIQPACVDVNLELTQEQLAKAFANHTIEGAAFGLSKRVSSGGVLREAVFQFHSFKECQGRVTEGSSTQGYLHDDQFCIEIPKGRLPEDTGMGLVVLVEDKYYLQGILSVNIKQEFSVVTNVSEHTTWLKAAVKKVMDNVQCKHMFICGNRACIHPSQKCDGYDDCGDGSDESYFECGNQPLSGVVVRSSCMLPPMLIDGVFDCIDEDCTLGGGEEVGFGKSVHLSCGLGSTVPETNPLGDYACLSSGKWSPEEPKCIRECEPLVKPHVNVTCEYNNQEVDCKGYMKPGTVATYVCDTFYTLQVATLLAKETECLPGGRWRSDLPECIPDCGFINPFASKATPTIAFGTDTKDVLEYPWHVALHNKNMTAGSPRWKQHCGGTLISSRLVLTAAHCLYTPDEYKRMKTENILVTAGKYKRDFYDKENAQQERAVKEAIIPAEYGGFDKRLSYDIALLYLEKPFEMSSYVLPICLKFQRGVDLSKTTGTVVGWGYTEKGIGHSSPILLKTEIPLVTLEDCRRIKVNATDNFQNFLTFDKFCGHFVNGSGPQKGDSGGGVIVQEGPKWYIIGIVSVKDLYNTMAALTNVYIHESFITTTINKFKKF